MVRPKSNKPYRVYDRKFMDKFESELDAYRYMEKMATKMGKEVTEFSIYYEGGIKI